MSDNVQFGEDPQFVSATPTYSPSPVLRDAEGSVFVSIVKKFGLARTDEQAYHVLTGISILALVFAIIILAYFVFDIGAPKEVPFNVPAGLEEKLPPDLQYKIYSTGKK